MAKENEVVMLSFPPHFSHKLQPVDQSEYGPFKKYLSSAQGTWMRKNPGKSMTIYNILQLVSEARTKALAPTTITNGFKVSGIVPFNREIFTEEDFLPSTVTESLQVQQESIVTPLNEFSAPLNGSSINW